MQTTTLKLVDSLGVPTCNDLISHRASNSSAELVPLTAQTGTVFRC